MNQVKLGLIGFNVWRICPAILVMVFFYLVIILGLYKRGFLDQVRKQFGSGEIVT